MINYVRHTVTDADVEAVTAVLRDAPLTQGPTIPAFEQALADQAGARYAVVVNSGTAAITLALRAAGVKVGSWVWTSPISFMATANAVLLAGGNLGFTDVDARGLVQGWAPRAQFFLPVTLGGQPLELSLKQRQKTVIVDACHGPLTLPDGATAACFSFHPAKHVACGEGGAVVTNDAALADTVRVLRDHGREINRRMTRLSGNYRMADLNAALGLSQLRRYDEGVRERRRQAAVYEAAFTGKVETVPHHPDSARHLYQVLVEDRDELRQRLEAQGITAQVHYPPIPGEPFYQGMFPGWERELPNAVRFAKHALSLPLYPGLTEEEQEMVINAVIEAVAEARLGV